LLWCSSTTLFISILYIAQLSVIVIQSSSGTRAFWKELFSLKSTMLCLSTAFYPQTHGQSEVANRILGVYLRCLAEDRPNSSSLEATPFQVVYGFEPPSPMSYQPDLSKVPAVDKHLMTEI
jgi:hypothetical protein